MKEERFKNKSEAASEVLAWVNRSRKLEEKKNAEKEKALQLSKIFEEQVVFYPHFLVYFSLFPFSLSNILLICVVACGFYDSNN